MAVNVGLVLSGGGARAAYQVGAIRGIAEILGQKTSPFSIMTGVSAGAINSTALAIGADDFPAAAALLAETWMSLTPDRVYRTDIPSLTGLGARWIKDLTTGGVLGKSHSTYLLDTAPLHELLHATLDTDRLRVHYASGVLRGAAVLGHELPDRHARSRSSTAIRASSRGCATAASPSACRSVSTTCSRPRRSRSSFRPCASTASSTATAACA